MLYLEKAMKLIGAISQDRKVSKCMSSVGGEVVRGREVKSEVRQKGLFVVKTMWSWKLIR